jgi:phage gp37-like protein
MDGTIVGKIRQRALLTVLHHFSGIQSGERRGAAHGYIHIAPAMWVAWLVQAPERQRADRAQRPFAHDKAVGFTQNAFTGTAPTGSTLVGNPLQHITG